MPITVKQGDLFKEYVEGYVNAVNCQGRMGAGVALEFAKRFPIMYRKYKVACDTKTLVPGTIQVVPEVWPETNREVTIINFPTKNEVYKGSEISYISDGLAALRRYLLTSDAPESLVIPALGCGYGGLPWAVVKPMIISALSGLPQDIRLIEPWED